MEGVPTPGERPWRPSLCCVGYGLGATGVGGNAEWTRCGQRDDMGADQHPDLPWKDSVLQEGRGGFHFSSFSGLRAGVVGQWKMAVSRPEASVGPWTGRTQWPGGRLPGRPALESLPRVRPEHRVPRQMRPLQKKLEIETPRVAPLLGLSGGQQLELWSILLGLRQTCLEWLLLRGQPLEIRGREDHPPD